ncbi:hypothetical protein Lc367_0865 [Lactobacillus crispatus EM-LC1]|nr:hypothetical protein Lc367_0865 [Lactobacillus crispatus EM-LC1]
MSFYDTKSQANLMLERVRKLIEDHQSEYLNLIDVVKDEKNIVDKLTVCQRLFLPWIVRLDKILFLR